MLYVANNEKLLDFPVDSDFIVQKISFLIGSLCFN